MKNPFVPLIVIILAFVFLDPLMLVMPPVALYGVMAVFLALFLSYATALWNEEAQDEREYVHRAYAGRVAYLAGAFVLVLGILYQAFFIHSVDPLLILTLSVMVIAKFLGHWHVQSK